MSAVITVREPRTGFPYSDPSWASWRARWTRRPMTLRQRVRLCAWCWGFGSIDLVDGQPVPVPCLSCGRSPS